MWIDEMNPEFMDALRAEGVDVVALIQASYPDVPSFSVHDLFYGSNSLAAYGQVIAPAAWIDDASYRTYARCIQRVGFYPASDFFEPLSGGVVLTTDLEDWARVHLSNALRLLEGVVADEVWFSFTPHLGVDNMVALAALRSQRKCLVFSQIKFATKFSWKLLGNNPSAAAALEWKPWQGGAVQPNLFYMRGNDFTPWNRDLGTRLGFLAQRLARADWSAVSSRLYQAARKRRAWGVMYALELVDRRTRPWAGNRLHFRRQFDSMRQPLRVPNVAQPQGDFVYFPLHLEPEENVHVLGGHYTNQLDALVALHSRLPPGWTILLKENPKQTHLHRGQPFDARIADLPNAHFVEPSFPSKELIAQSRLVASITGTAGYEALLVGKPCIHFGDAWYAGLPGAFAFEADMDLAAASKRQVSIDELDSAVDQLLSGLADGLAHPRYAGIYRDTHDIGELYRQAAQSMCKVSAAIDQAV